jgi:hypothetical protein
MKLAMNVATDCYRAFLQTRSDMGCFMKALWSNLLLAARLTPLVRLLEPKRKLVNKILRRSLRKQKLTLSQSLDTSFSANCLQFIRFSIQPSSVGIEPGSLVGDRR